MKPIQEYSFFERRCILKNADFVDCYRPALFLDRDGVIIKDLHYVSKKEDVILEKGIDKLISFANKHGWPVVVITNQSGISRGYFTWEEYENVNNHLISLLEEKECNLDAIYANAYGPDSSHLSWRKPSPSMLIEAALDLKINLKSSIIVGDRKSDVIAGAKAGLATVVHVLTGHGEEERSNIIKNIDNYSDYDSINKFKFKIDNFQASIILIDNLNYFPFDLFNRKQEI